MRRVAVGAALLLAVAAVAWSLVRRAPPPPPVPTAAVAAAAPAPPPPPPAPVTAPAAPAPAAPPAPVDPLAAFPPAPRVAPPSGCDRWEFDFDDGVLPAGWRSEDVADPAVANGTHGLAITDRWVDEQHPRGDAGLFFHTGADGGDGAGFTWLELRPGDDRLSAAAGARLQCTTLDARNFGCAEAFGWHDAGSDTTYLFSAASGDGRWYARQTVAAPERWQRRGRDTGHAGAPALRDGSHFAGRARAVGLAVQADGLALTIDGLTTRWSGLRLGAGWFVIARGQQPGRRNKANLLIPALALEGVLVGTDGRPRPAAPRLRPVAMAADGALEVAIETAPDATARWTIDGGDPDPASPVAAPLLRLPPGRLGEVRAIAVAGDGVSAVRRARWLVPGTGTGLRAAYHADPAADGEALVERIEPGIAAAWPAEPAPGVPADGFGVRWWGRLTVPATGTWRFHLAANDAVRLWIDGRLVVDEWVHRTDREITVELPLSGGGHDLTLHYADHILGAGCTLAWSGPGVPRQTIPAGQFAPVAGPAPRAAGEVAFIERRTEGAVEVELRTATPGAVIRATSDGAPVTESAPAVDGPLRITAGTRVRARAFAAGLLDGPTSDRWIDPQPAPAPGWTAELGSGDEGVGPRRQLALPAVPLADPLPAGVGDDAWLRLHGELLVPVSDQYRIAADATGGVRVRIGDDLVIDGWGGPRSSGPEPLAGPWRYAGSRWYTAGRRLPVVVEYRRACPGFPPGLPPRLALTWASARQPEQPLPVHPAAAPEAGGLLLAVHGDDAAAVETVASEPWWEGRPDDGARTLRFSGVLIPPRSGEWTFQPGGDGGVRVLLDGRLLVDQWGGRREGKGPRAKATLEAGRPYRLQIESRHERGPGAFALRWRGPGQGTALIDRAFLRPEPVALVPPPPVVRERAVDGGVELRLDCDPPLPGATIRYTLDGGEPGTASPVYTGPVRLARDAVVRALAIAPDGAVGAASATSVVASGPGTGLVEEFFTAPDFAGQRIAGRDRAVNAAWESAAPDDSRPPPAFSIRWAGRILPRHGERYRFTLVTNNAARLWIAGRLVIDGWEHRGRGELAGEIDLAAGVRHPLLLEYQGRDPDYVAVLRWASPSQADEIVPAAALTGDTTGILGDGGGLLATWRIWRDGRATGEAITRIEPVVDQRWAAVPPLEGLDPACTATRWEGEVQAPVDDEWVFHVEADHAVRLWIDGALVIDDWRDGPVRERRSRGLRLAADRRVALRLEHARVGREGLCRLRWSSRTRPPMPVTRDRLFPAATPSPEPLPDLPARSDAIDLAALLALPVPAAPAPAPAPVGTSAVGPVEAAAGPPLETLYYYRGRRTLADLRGALARTVDAWLRAPGTQPAFGHAVAIALPLDADLALALAAAEVRLAGEADLPAAVRRWAETLRATGRKDALAALIDRGPSAALPPGGDVLAAQAALQPPTGLVGGAAAWSGFAWSALRGDADGVRAGTDALMAAAAAADEPREARRLEAVADRAQWLQERWRADRLDAGLPAERATALAEALADARLARDLLADGPAGAAVAAAPVADVVRVAGHLAQARGPQDDLVVDLLLAAAQRGWRGEGGSARTLLWAAIHASGRTDRARALALFALAQRCGLAYDGRLPHQQILADQFAAESGLYVARMLINDEALRRTVPFATAEELLRNSLRLAERSPHAQRWREDLRRVQVDLRAAYGQREEALAELRRIVVDERDPRLRLRAAVELARHASRIRRDHAGAAALLREPATAVVPGEHTLVAVGELQRLASDLRNPVLWAEARALARAAWNRADPADAAGLRPRLQALIDQRLVLPPAAPEATPLPLEELRRIAAECRRPLTAAEAQRLAADGG